MKFSILKITTMRFSILIRPLQPFFISLSFIFFSVFAHAQNLNAWQDPNYIERAFIEVALKNEYRKTDQRIVKWEHPIRYQIQYLYIKPYPIADALIKAHLQDLESYTHLSIDPAGKRRPNFRIIFTQDRYFKDVIAQYAHSRVQDIDKKANCMGTFQTNRQHEITHATVVIPVDHALAHGLLPACVVEETTQVLGLPNDSDWVNPSIANDASKIDLLTGLDYIMLKILYDPTLKPALKAGMPLKVSRPIIRQRIKELKKRGEIKRASRIVNRGELARMVN